MDTRRSESAVLGDLQPTLVWRLFEAISRVPRCSKREKQIRAWIRSWARRRNIPCKTDSAGNLLLRRAASPGRARLPGLVLQAHLDMVCVKEEGLAFDFHRDPIPIRLDGTRVWAEGTTLGADNGIGVAYALAALVDPELRCGPLEVLLTVDEEAGGSGALGLKAGFLTGDYLLNLDSEETGVITIGTAGIETTDFQLRPVWKTAARWSAFSLSVRGLAGGHSGMEIHLPRLNAVKLVVEALGRLAEMPLRMGPFNAGETANAIPAGADCTVLVPAEARDRALAVLEKWRREVLDRAGSKEPNLEIAILADKAQNGRRRKAITIEDTDTIRRLLGEIPHGPLSWSGEIEGLVESSANLARVRSGRRRFEITVSYRSCRERAMEQLGETMRNLGRRRGASTKRHSRAPGWTARPESPFTRLVEKHYSRALGRPVELKAFHAGLECGIFTGFAPDLQMASIGPDIHSVHTPEESVDIRSVALLWDALRRIIEGMAEL